MRISFRGFVLAVFFVGGTAFADTFYVAPPPGGNDANPGTLGSPWATLQHAADVIQPGDTVLVRAGSYAGAQFTTSGTAALPIVVQAFPGEEVEIVADNPSTPDGINLEGASYMTVAGFRVDGRTRAGIRAVLCEHVTIRDNRTDANGRWGIFTGFCDDLLIEGNVTTNSFDEHGIYVSNSGDRPMIRGNLIFGNNANGIHMNGDVSQGGDGVIRDAVVENNVIYDNGVAGGSGINCDGVQDSILRNNLIFDTHASGISLYRIDGGQPSTGNKVYNNTVLVASDGRWGLNVRDGSSGNLVRNNVFYSDHSFRGAMSISMDSLPGFSSDSNAVEDRFTLDDGDSVLTLAQWRTQTGQDADSFATTPAALFVDLAGDDYHPRDGSPLLDAGETLAEVPTDLEGTSRPLGPAYDVGAYEGAGVIFADGFESGDVSRWSP
jgi:parallel beta-helix repeat protein